MHKREWLAHRALRAMADACNQPNNPDVLARMDAATLELCPSCEHGILYCRCYENAPLDTLSTPNRVARDQTP